MSVLRLGFWLGERSYTINHAFRKFKGDYLQVSLGVALDLVPLMAYIIHMLYFIRQRVQIYNDMEPFLLDFDVLHWLDEDVVSLLMPVDKRSLCPFQIRFDRYWNQE